MLNKVHNEYKIKKWKDKLQKLSNQREKNISKYIIPIEIKMEQLRDKIRSFNPDYNQY